MEKDYERSELTLSLTQLLLIEESLLNSYARSTVRGRVVSREILDKIKVAKDSLREGMFPKEGG